MLTLQDCIELCDVTEDEIAGVAEHERFLVGLEKALFPLGEIIAEQLTANARRLPRVRSIWVFPLATRVRLDRVENRVAVLMCVNAGRKMPG
jgi:hypothetical protein